MWYPAELCSAGSDTPQDFLQSSVFFLGFICFKILSIVLVLGTLTRKYCPLVFLCLWNWCALVGNRITVNSQHCGRRYKQKSSQQIVSSVYLKSFKPLLYPPSEIFAFVLCLQQSVSILDTESMLLTILTGAPKGFWPVPLLFLLYIDDLPSLSLLMIRLLLCQWQLDRSMALYIYKANNCELLAVLTNAQRNLYLNDIYIKTLFNKDLLLTIKYWYIKNFSKHAIC